MESSGAQTLAMAIGLGAALSAVADRFRIVALPLLLGAGVILGKSGLGIVDASSMGPILGPIIALSIGLLVFEGSLHLTPAELRRAPRAVLGLLSVGAIVTWAGVALLAWLLLGFHPIGALLLGACLIVTGPTVVQPLLRHIRLTPSLHTTLAAEAVFIDPVGVLATIAAMDIAKAYLATGHSEPSAALVVNVLVKPLVGGALVGVLAGVAGLLLARRMVGVSAPDAKRLNLLAMSVCMTAFGVGELLAPSGGLIATTLAAMIFGGAKVTGVHELRTFKEQLSVILVGMLFLLLASTVDLRALTQFGWKHALFILGLIFLVRPACVFASTVGSTLSTGERLFAALFAPRGIVALSVASIIAMELQGVKNPEAPISGPLVDVGGPLQDVQILTLIIFLVIVATVAMSITIASPLSRLLKVRLAAPNGVLIVGIHPVSIALGTFLQGRGVRVELIDASQSKVGLAIEAGLPAVAGDATNVRFLDDHVNRSEVGWAIAATGNVDVDQVVARWAQDRMGESHASIWSSKPTRPEFESIRPRWPISLELANIRVQRNELTIRAWPQTEAASGIPLGVMSKDKFQLLVPNAKTAAEADVVGLIDQQAYQAVVGREVSQIVQSAAPAEAPKPAET